VVGHGVGRDLTPAEWSAQNGLLARDDGAAWIWVVSLTFRREQVKAEAVLYVGNAA